MKKKMQKLFQKLSGALGVAPAAFFLLFLGLFLLYLYTTNSRVYVIEDKERLMGMMDSSLPENIRIEDPVWGTVSISDPETVQSFYNDISSLQPSNREGRISGSREILYGTLYMSDGALHSFELGEGIRIDGVEYEAGEYGGQLAAYLSLFKNRLYTTHNLSNIVKAQSKVRMRKLAGAGTEGEERTLAMDQKNALRKILLSAKPLEKTVQGWKNVLQKGRVIWGIELYVDENSKSPEVYIVHYENGLCMVFDSYGSQSGSILQCMADGESLQKIFLNQGFENTGEMENQYGEEEEASRNPGEGAITLLGSYHEDMIKALAQEFEKKSGCRINYVRMSTGEAKKGLLEGKSAPKYDVWIGGTVDAHETLKKQGILAPYEALGEDRIASRYRDPDHVWKPQYLEVLSIGVNRERWEREFAGKEIPYPDRLEDLLHPAFKGEIVIPNPSVSGTGYILFASILEALGQEAGWEYIRNLNKQVGQYTDSGFSAAEKTGLGEYLICIDFLSDQSLVGSFGYPMESRVYEKAGWTLVPVSLVQSEEIRPQARAFIDFCLSDEALEILEGLGNVTPVEKNKERNQKDLENAEERIPDYNQNFSPWLAAGSREEILEYFTREILLEPEDGGN